MRIAIEYTKNGIDRIHIATRCFVSTPLSPVLSLPPDPVPLPGEGGLVKIEGGFSPLNKKMLLTIHHDDSHILTATLLAEPGSYVGLRINDGFLEVYIEDHTS